MNISLIDLYDGKWIYHHLQIFALNNRAQRHPHIHKQRGVNGQWHTFLVQEGRRRKNNGNISPLQASLSQHCPNREAIGPAPFTTNTPIEEDLGFDKKMFETVLPSVLDQWDNVPQEWQLPLLILVRNMNELMNDVLDFKEVMLWSNPFWKDATPFVSFVWSWDKIKF